MTKIPAQVRRQINAEFPSYALQRDDNPIIPISSSDNWILGYEWYRRLIAAAKANTSLRLLPDGKTYSRTNIGPIEVQHTHICSSESGSIRVNVRKGDLRDLIAVIYIDKEYIRIDSPRLWGERQEFCIAVEKTELIIQDLEAQLEQYCHLI